jgi:hypothetical protein
MTTTDTRRPLWRRPWVRITGSIAALALVGGADAAGATLARPHAVVTRPAANTAPAHPKTAPRPAHSTPPPAPAANGARPAPAGSDKYAQDILNAGITAPVSWIDSTGQKIVADWKAGYTAAWTDQNVLLPDGVYPYHLATFDQITARDLGVTPPAQGIQPQAAPPVLSVTGYTGTRPGMISFSGDSGYVITNITWSSWGSGSAYGTGTSNIQGCVPDCADGSETPYTTTVSLSAPYGGHFTHVTAVRNGQVTSGSTALITGAQQYTPAPPPAPVSGDPVAGTGTGPACTTIAVYFDGGLPGHRDSTGFCVPDKA